jgi:polynucleotide 5'-hydroxyl-kinase GRC3/NOL9
MCQITQSATDPLKRPLTPENAPEDWLRAIEEIAGTAAITTVIGPPCSGKSTFAKRLLNRYLTGMGKTMKPVPLVYYLDLDYRKPEYTLHGQISLTIVYELNLGPSFTQPGTILGRAGMNRILAAHFLPVQGITDYEDYFTSCAHDLFQTYRNFLSEGIVRPLIVNTPASLYTTHFPLLQKLLTTLRPNHIIHLSDTTTIDPTTASKLHTLQTFSQTISTTFHELAAQHPPLLPSRTDGELRAMSMQSYFHLSTLKTRISSSGSSNEIVETTWDPRPLSHLTPWEFCYEETPTRCQDFIGVLPLFEPLPPSQLLTALTGTVIHIVETTSPIIESQYDNLPRTTEHNFPYFAPNPALGKVEPLDPQTSRLVCTALVRGFDHEEKVVQIIVPKTHNSFLQNLAPERTVFVAGCCDTPEWAYTEDAYYQLDAQRNNLQTGGKFVGEGGLTDGVPLPFWVEKRSTVEEIGYLSTVRRVRKFLG